MIITSKCVMEIQILVRSFEHCVSSAHSLCSSVSGWSVGWQVGIWALGVGARRPWYVLVYQGNNWSPGRRCRPSSPHPVLGIADAEPSRPPTSSHVPLCRPASSWETLCELTCFYTAKYLFTPQSSERLWSPPSQRTKVKLSLRF
jgi:hypothetical protein